MTKKSRANAFIGLLLLAGLTMLNPRCHAATATLSMQNINGIITEEITVTLTNSTSYWGSVTFWCNRVGYSTSSLTFAVDHVGAGTYDYPEDDLSTIHAGYERRVSE